jgi:flavin-dependent dehydrogenase
MRRVSLAIVGGGPAGVSTALFLAAIDPTLGRRAVVLEKGRYPRDKICAGAIAERADLALAAIGVRVDVPSVTIRGMAATTRAGRVVRRLEHRIGRVVRRIEFDAELARLARGRGIAIEEGASVRAIKRTAAGVEIALEGGETLVADALVGADGVGSVVRRQLGFGRGEVFAQVVELDTEGCATDVDPDILSFDLTDRSLRGYAWDFPTPLDGQLRWCRGVYDLVRGDEPDASQRALARLDAGTAPLGKVRRFSERGFVRRGPLSTRRVLLVGEAAGIDPVLGEGIAQAILYGRAAAAYLAPRLSRGDLGFADFDRHLARSDVGQDLWRRSLSLPFVYLTDRAATERWVMESAALGRVGLAYFGGLRYAKRDLARAVLDGARAWALTRTALRS